MQKWLSFKRRVEMLAMSLIELRDLDGLRVYVAVPVDRRSAERIASAHIQTLFRPMGSIGFCRLQPGQRIRLRFDVVVAGRC